ncbi:2-amino-4-hydroxy-6-hydroxymethyldihydropteridine diphosphokinase [Prochlorococcus marinus]|uniref:2-amino-4-hydroxy-6-hydroxymethyldihydropteridine diphosphokinase n=1 Tax=Prochlorococcus marinus XMU1408 TaxID=2213228 RepID=A0A318QZA9_PROMR|nr:2-amino-4-hydroxy-6-hydroxymethyldihydropteridine diphosphokinase [Prochlorococcus marinus]MBW3041345.1 2-amino-4-hydroxy-6-hydroxymethyldihydropteridine diphosphokinase [Prochlorococcus marinus str. XMU1408]PYE02516.1 2-amino-4-hydroxy-6-hydroxymethyldihydropteridine diphosphokinase [Prochlorococcus marinus XMU1408]
MTYAKQKTKLKLVISIGANIPGILGDPIKTIAAMRPQIEKSILEWNVALNRPKIDSQNIDKSLSFQWAPLFETEPLGGPIDQPKFINTVLVVEGKNFSSVTPNKKAAMCLMKKFLDLEKIAGRERENTKVFWGPRSLDIDFISWGGLQINTETLILPHPRLSERNFVLIPLAEVLSKAQGKPKQIHSPNIWPE